MFSRVPAAAEEASAAKIETTPEPFVAGVEAREVRRVRAPGRELVSADIQFGGQTEPVEVVNYHHQGACLLLSDSALALLSFVDSGDLRIAFRIGRKALLERHRFRIAWADTASRHIGIQLLPIERTKQVQRAPRYRLSRHLACNATVVDPLQPQRTIYMKVEDLSMTGVSLSTSLVNSHVLPGMTLRNAKLQIPGRGEHEVDLYVENTRPSSEPASFILGASVLKMDSVCRKALGSFVVSLQAQAAKPETLRELRDSDLIGKSLRQDLTFQFVESEALYLEVLRLRYAAYELSGKVDKTFDEYVLAADGLANEGVVLAAHLGNRLVATIEMRFEKLGHALQTLKYPEATALLRAQTRSQLGEVNRFAIHPDVQGTDVVIGCMQIIQSVFIARGTTNLCMLSSEELIPLYEGVGLKRLPFELPHEVRKGSTLTLMWMSTETSTQSKNINPLIWERVFSGVHDFYAQMGLVDAMIRSTSYRARRLLGFATAFVQERLRRRRRKKLKQSIKNNPNPPRVRVALARNPAAAPPEPSKETPRSEFANDLVVHARLTQAHFRASVLVSYLKESDVAIGAAHTESILNGIGLSRNYFADPENWVSVSFLDAFLDAYEQHGDVYDLARRAAERGVSKEELGVKWYAVRAVVSPQTIFEQLGRFIPQLNRTRTFRILLQRPGCVRVELGILDRSLIPKHDSSCENIKRCFESYLHLLTDKWPRVTQLSSVYEGASADVYEIHWDPRLVKRFDTFRLVSWQFAGGLLAVATILLTRVSGASAFMLAGLCVLAANLLRSRSELKTERKQTLTTLSAFQEIEETAARKYDDIHAAKESLARRANESLVLERLASKVLALEGIDVIISSALRAICRDFDFDRAILMMLESESSHMLRTVAIEGLAEVPDDLWAFQVDVSVKRDSPLVLSSVFLSGEPVLISDVERHFFQINETSRRLLRNLKSDGFIIVPISSDKGKRGVIIADRLKDESKKVLCRDDVLLLQRVANLLAIALDKEARIEEQRTLRGIFERYVPADVITSAVNAKGKETLGGTQRTVTALFFDIRNFTKTTERMSPAAVVAYVNKIFSDVEEIVRRSGGRVDKYLGDGLLAVWGSLCDSENGDAGDALSAALALLNHRAALNASLAVQGYPAIDFGIGLHTGEALVGHVGGETRCEFTCMGPAINMASRMEGLCKGLGVSLVVSQGCFDAARREVDASLRAFTWESREVLVRGFSDPQWIFTVKSGAGDGSKKETQSNVDVNAEKNRVLKLAG